ncbi:RING-H2 finger protein ATL40-like [Mercurialis annua]|uniref:RING-H2 finger protein ATL40-like n=1 Tax=Mercurialis annua TaxID=3986 RepID=UPI00215E49E2|nr:RING-H2 finger protein ATL40-like [Mercurialis annua]
MFLSHEHPIMPKQMVVDPPFLHHKPPPSAMDFAGMEAEVNDRSLFSHRNTYDLNSKIMLTAIISLSFVVVLVIVLHIYARCILRRHARRRSIIGRLGLATISSEPRRTGLDPGVIASLPIFVYKQTNNSVDQENQECAVCLSFLEDQEMAMVLPNCRHTFHAECIDKWLASHSTCPICRTEAEPRIQPVSREGPVAGPAIAPPLEGSNGKASGSSMSRLSSFRRILSRERSSRRIQAEIRQEEGFEDLERQ